MAVSSPTDFQPAEGFYVPEDSGVLFSLSPTVLLLILLLVAIAAVVGWMMGKQRRPTDDPTAKIYSAIDKAVKAAAGAPRDSVMITARHLRAVVDAQLGSVLALNGGLARPSDALDRALEGVEDAPHRGHKDDHRDGEPGAIEKLVINARRVVFNTTHPGHGDDHDAPSGHDDHDDKGHADHGAGHGPVKHMDHKAQLAAVRAAVHAFSDHWSDKPARLAELRGARRQLTSSPASSASERPWDKSKPAH